LQKTNQNVSTLFKIVFSLPSNRFVLPAFHIVLFVIIQIIITFAYKGDLYLIPFGFVGVIFYLLVLRYLTGKRVSFSTIRRVSATHSFFLLLTFLATVILVLLSKPLYSYISALSAVFSFSYVILRGEFLEGRLEPLVSLLFYYFFLLLPIYRAIEKSFNYVELYFWIAALIITAAFYYSVDRIALNKLGVKLPKLTQGVLDAWMVEYTEGFEKLLESNSIKIKTKTYCIKLKKDGSSSCIIIPPVHPGPFKGVGSYNITEVIAEHFKKKGFDDVIVLHSASNHDMNLPSKKSMMEYIAQLDAGAEEKVIKAFKIFKEEGKYFAYHGISTDVCDLVITMPKIAMDDFPMGFMQILYNENKKREKDLIIVDSHSNLSSYVGNVDFYEPLKIKTPLPDFKELYFAVEKLDSSNMEEVGKCGVYRIEFSDGYSRLKILYVDSNNALPNVREAIYESTGYLVVTSDTHTVKTFANRKGYWAFGELTDIQKIIKMIKNKPDLNLEKVEASLLIWNNEISVIGEEGLNKLKQAMGLSLKFLKYYLAAICALFVFAVVI
jgi:putative membrane protein